MPALNQAPEISTENAGRLTLLILFSHNGGDYGNPGTRSSIDKTEHHACKQMHNRRIENWQCFTITSKPQHLAWVFDTPINVQRHDLLQWYGNGSMHGCQSWQRIQIPNGIHTARRLTHTRLSWKLDNVTLEGATVQPPPIPIPPTSFPQPHTVILHTLSP